MDILSPGVFIGTWRHLYVRQSPPPLRQIYIHTPYGGRGERQTDLLCYDGSPSIQYKYAQLGAKGSRYKTKHFKSDYCVYHIHLYFFFNYWVDPASNMVEDQPAVYSTLLWDTRYFFVVHSTFVTFVHIYTHLILKYITVHRTISDTTVFVHSSLFLQLLCSYSTVWQLEAVCLSVCLP